MFIFSRGALVQSRVKTFRMADFGVGAENIAMTHIKQVNLYGDSSCEMSGNLGLQVDRCDTHSLSSKSIHFYDTVRTKRLKNLILHSQCSIATNEELYVLSLA